MDGVVKAKVPGTLAVPPVRVDEVRVCPIVIALATGPEVIDGVAREIVNVSDAPAELAQIIRRQLD